MSSLENLFSSAAHSATGHEFLSAFLRGTHYALKILSYPIHEIPEIEANVEQVEISAAETGASTELALEEGGDSAHEIKEGVKSQRESVLAHKTHSRALKGLFKNYAAALLRNSVFTAPSLALSVLEPELVSTFIDTYRSAFLLLALHMALRAEQASHHPPRHHVSHEVGETPNPDEVLGTDIIHPAASATRLSTFSHYSAALETTAAVLFLIHDLPTKEKLLTSAFIMVGMPTVVLGFSSALVFIEDTGQRLQNLTPNTVFGKALTTKHRLERIGLALERMASPSYGKLQLLGEFLLNAGIGRVFYRALPQQEAWIQEAGHTIAHHLPFPDGLSEWGIRDAFWGATGFVVGKAARKVYNHVKASPICIKSGKAAHAWTMAAAFEFSERGIGDAISGATAFVVGKVARKVCDHIKASPIFMESGKAAQAWAMAATLEFMEQDLPQHDFNFYATRPKLNIPGTRLSVALETAPA